MKPEFDRDELLRLIDRLTTETITPTENERLEALLQRSADARRTYFAYLDLDLGLREIALGRSSEIPPPVGTSCPVPSCGDTVVSPGRSVAGYVIVAAVASLATAVLFMLTMSRPESLPDTPTVHVPTSAQDDESPNQVAASEYVATLVFADECLWDAPSESLVEGQRLATGDLRLREGLALLRFDGGAIAVLTGDAFVDLESRGSLRLRHGRLNVRAPEEAIGFTVRTPVSDVVDLGTEFALDVARNGTTELHVLEGAVEYRQSTSQPGSGQRLNGGQAVRFDWQTKQPKTVRMKAKRMEDLLRERNPRPREDLLVVYEGFQYEVGHMPLAAANGGWGWLGPWRLRRPDECGMSGPDTTRDMLIAFQKLNVPWPIHGGRAGMLEMPPGENYRLRPLAEPIDLARDTVYYISMLLGEEAAAATDPSAKRGEAARLTFRSSNDFWGDCICFGFLPTVRKAHVEMSGHIRFTGAGVPEGESLLWAAKIISRRHGQDEIFFRVYQEGESLDLIEPAKWDIATRGVSSNARLDQLVLTSTGETRRWFDEIRIGTSWRAVIPIERRTEILAREK